MHANRTRPTFGAQILLATLAMTCACGSESTQVQPPPAVAEAKPPPQPQPPREDPTRLLVQSLSILEGADLSQVEEVDIALPSPEACAGLNLAAIAEATPRLHTLRVSGCVDAVHAGLASFAVRELELSDLPLDAITVGRLAQMTGLQTLTLTRVEAVDAPVQALSRISLQTLRLRELARDSDLGQLLGLWPRSLKTAAIIGRWAGHAAMLGLSKAEALEVLELTDTRVGNFSLNQIKPLHELREVRWSGTTFTDLSPLYFRDLPVQRFTCHCPRLGDGGLRSLRYSKGLRRLELSGTQVTGAGLDALTKLGAIEEVVLPDLSLGPEGFAALASLPALRRLELGGVLEHPDLAGLGGLSALRELRLVFPTLDDRAAPAIGALTGLQRLDLGGTQISDVGLEPLAKLVDLRELKLHHTRVTNRGLAHVGKLRELRVLELDHTDVVDEGIVHLQHLTKLEELRLDQTLVTDACLDHLLALRGLTRINLAGTVISAEAAQRLADLPNLQAVNLQGTR